VKTVDLSGDVAGGFAAKLLASSGLRVVRPASPTQHLDLLRVYLDAGKEVVDLPAGTPLPEVVDADDLVIVTFDRGTHTSLPDGWTLADLPAGCVVVTTSTFGMTGPYSGWRGGPLAQWAAGGYLGLTGEPGRPPLTGPEHLCGYVTGYTAALAAEAALRHRARTGQAPRVDVSAMEAMASVHQSTFSRLAEGIVRERTGRYTEVYPLVVRPCQDGHVSLGVVTDAEFDRLALALGRDDLAVEPRFAGKADRWTHRDALDQELATVLSTLRGDEVVERLTAFGVAAATVTGPHGVLANPQLAARGFWRRAAGLGSMARMPGDPVPKAATFPAAGVAHPIPLDRAPRDARLPLAGVTVVDLTAFWAGPLATRWLADLGADVLWLERPGSRVEPDDETDPTARVMHVFHLKMNRNKRSAVVDLRVPAGRQLALDLATRADVLVENYRPGVMDGFGLGPATLCGANPRLVYVSLSGFGATGPWAARRSYGPTIEAASSIEGRTGYPGGEPLRLGHTLPDAVGGLAGALAVLRGLRGRDVTGTGGWFDVSQLETYAAMSGEDILAASLAGLDPPRIGNRSRHGAIQGVFRCVGDDEWVAIRLAGPGDLARLAEVTGLSSLAGAGSPRDDDAIDAAIASFTRTRGKHDTAALLQEAGIEAFAVLNPVELRANEHLSARGFFVPVPRGDGPDLCLPGSPLASTPALTDPRGPAPRVGEHTAEILAQLHAVTPAPS
jgi:crotonobetainyl-CoA:carnitine CoA-transferase CaiB-like acyl-CoA transferase